MTTRTRDWLRSFLHLGARAEKDGIPAADIERQEDTVISALTMLDERPGVILADEVGMGKTFEAIGIAAAVRHINKRSRIVVVTPGPDLNSKWVSEFSRFQEMFDFGDDVISAQTLPAFAEGIRKHPVVVAPVTMFQSGKGYGEQTYMLSLYFHWRQLPWQTANAVMARFRDGEYERIDVTTERFLGIFELNEVMPHLGPAFRRGKGEGALGLDDLYENGGLDAFENGAAVTRALYRARFELTGRLMPTIDLLIVDEAHKLKNPGSLRASAMRRVFDKLFRKALLLTATPFQLDVTELREVLSLFASAKGAPSDLDETVEGLLMAVKNYQDQYDAFQQTWMSMDPAVAARFCAMYDADPEKLLETDEPALRVVTQQVTALKLLKNDVIEPGFRQWMIRSLRDDKRIYRQSIRRTIPADGAEALPFLIYERFIAELFRRGRQTHKAAVEINMVSSYSAAQHGAIMSSQDGIPPEAEVYRELLREVLGEIESSPNDHPKLSDVITDALDAANRGEKTLIFCSRVATLEQLRRELDAIWEARVLERWRVVYPGAGATEIFDKSEGADRRQRGRQSLLQSRFHRPQDALYLALREPYMRTYVPLAEWALGRLPEIVEEANRLLGEVRVGKTSAERIDYHVAQRCIEQAVLTLWVPPRDLDIGAQSAIGNLLSMGHVRMGRDAADDPEDDSVSDKRPQWQISERIVQAVLRGGNLWESMSGLLGQLSWGLRVKVVEQLARYLTYKQVPFLADLLTEANAAGLSVEPVESAALVDFLPNFWRTATGKRYIALIESFLSYFLQRDAQQQLDILEGPIRTGELARHTKEGESRDRLREAFNTPLYPMILLANEVMQEGLDLHKHCRRVVHHDLVWNPAQIEQRIGRIDRLGSLTSRLRQDGGEATLDVLYPVIRGTIDERLFRTVKTREKWLEFLLGAPPSFSEYSFDDDEPLPLPEQLAIDLSIDLAPTRQG